MLASVLLLLQIPFNLYSSHLNRHKVTESTAVKKGFDLTALQLVSRWASFEY